MKDEINNKYINKLLKHITLLFIIILTIVCIALSNMAVIPKLKTLINLKIINLNIYYQ